MVSARHAGFLCPLLLALVFGCGGGGKSEQPINPTNPPSQKPPPNPPPAPGPSPLAPIPPAIMAQHDHDPFNRSILEAYNRQVAALEAEGQPYGADFQEVPAVDPPGYLEDYFTHDSTYGNPSFMDGIQRPLIHCAQDPGNVMTKVYEGLYRADSGPGRGWDIPAVRRVTGFLFTGSKLPPATIASNGGLWCNIFSRGPEAAPLPHCVELMDQKTPLHDAFNLARYLFVTDAGGFVSLTRSVSVARYFALNIGYKGKAAGEGYVYVVQASGGLDATHPSLKKPWVLHEQEVAVPGVVPWSRVVAYRRIVRNPGTQAHPAPPEFTGPIHVRAGLEAVDPGARTRILQDLSRKSLFTRDQEQGQEWRSKVKLSYSEDHLNQFRKAHPKVDPGDASLW